MTETTNVATRPTRLGCVYLPQFAPEWLAATARGADEAGLDELWVWEDCFLTGGISAAAIALSSSNTLTVGVGVAPVPMRNPALTAMEVATLARAFPGRVRVGVGHGVQDWMAQIGAKVGSPMTLLREHLTCITALLRGDRVTYQGRYVRLDDVALDWPPPPDTELLAAAVGPKTLRLTGELASGTVITQCTTPAELREAVAHVRAGNALVGPTKESSIVVYVLSAAGPNAEADLAAEIKRWDADKTGDLGVCGTAEGIALGVRRWVDAGADTIVLQPPVDAAIEDFVRFAGTEVKPLL
ncbi:flavin-dependent oxidoreductase, F420-dependent methylene-tetrahydromethanopterin reductase [Mycolicibacterium chubuense NBB4]|uniref:Flavin-dependent oxidoreductase, F420-dependent methylene-tetrahydromethanopterin reductase n=1 Tax=Mycolicibacterium chubuense (strain NBB4) TaxID=710421 RepID=I4BGQ1_MYCCN|nr:LLM class flavin-dependent oxidoreductase [Mycolicibacterium chubuense]AFM16458.1 flavin-dependent oxidoreductase, F420-dependent methylene-tetrahydromethanopterin reductase [Mycolicibacterium chubuense NBB4]